MAPPNKVLRLKIGGRPYTAYSTDAMERCLHDVTNHILTQREASEKYKIPRSTIILKLKAHRNSNVHVPGRKCFFFLQKKKNHSSITLFYCAIIDFPNFV
ncbi:unnamed protein product [Acanthoscelides obtectus]|uniref:HTH psq-type domain-containing protein n=1 Tax=Acanthoscelides obtectus TaxID=200917 RepID=A0A9P0L4S2_ACAOB|nr:unnamed protein product [Acanthoscelides obtectus]CAK1638317.1 hypothetical protein AOBTE_LOCUS10530 [Acanthoscelides obtectus]